jgi:hypothetical protein
VGGLAVICYCCGEDKKTDYFSYGNKGWTKHCKECGEWLRLFKARFGPSFESTERMGRKSLDMIRKEEAQEKVAQLYSVFGIQFPVEQQTVEVRTVLADAPWPYKEAA